LPDIGPDKDGIENKMPFILYVFFMVQCIRILKTDVIASLFASSAVDFLVQAPVE
jgi:hypothetical protein